MLPRSMLRSVVGTVAALTAVVFACGDGGSDEATPRRDAGPGGGDLGDARSPASEDGASPLESLSFTAKADEAPPSEAKLVAIWEVTAGDDYLYAFGGGTFTGTGVFVSFSSAPPAEALNGGKLGVGVLAFVDPRDDLPEGRVPSGAFDPTRLLAFAPDYAIVYRGTNDGLSSTWAESFPLGFSCGECVRSTNDEQLDTFTVTSCSGIRVVLYSKNVTFCNWT